MSANCKCGKPATQTHNILQPGINESDIDPVKPTDFCDDCWQVFQEEAQQQARDAQLVETSYRQDQSSYAIDLSVPGSLESWYPNNKEKTAPLDPAMELRRFEAEGKRQARVKIPFQLLLRLFDLPPSTEIIDVYVPQEKGDPVEGTMEILLEDYSLPLVAPLEKIPEAMLISKTTATHIELIEEKPSAPFPTKYKNSKKEIVNVPLDQLEKYHKDPLAWLKQHMKEDE